MDSKWAKSSYSADGACVEVRFQKSSYSSAAGDSVEVDRQTFPGTVMLRDSKHPERPGFHFTHDEWDAFIKGVKDGEFDLTS